MTQLLILNLIGTFVFGVSGGILAVRKKMDVFGVLVLSVVAALGGGMMRDVLLGHTPPATLNDWRYIAVAASAGVLVFVDHGRLGRWQTLIVTFDAAGLGLFTVTGTVAALNRGTQFHCLCFTRHAHWNRRRGLAGCSRGRSTVCSGERNLCARLAIGSGNHPCGHARSYPRNHNQYGRRGRDIRLAHVERLARLEHSHGDGERILIGKFKEQTKLDATS